MNRYPLWKYITVVVALLIGLIYTLPNFFGESPAVQVSSGKATLKVDTSTLERVESTLKAASIESNGTFLDTNGVKVRLKDTDTQLKAKDLHGVASKLAIAARVLRHEGGPAHQLVADAVAELDREVSVDSTIVRVHQHGAGARVVLAGGERVLRRR